MHLALIGLPGSGKSTIGRHLARQWKLPFVDSDHVIEQRIGGTIADYFSAHGEEAFRDIESEVIASLLRSDTMCVLATGGGAILRPANREQLQRHSTVFYLQTTPEDIARRLRNDGHRPLLKGDDPLVRIKALFEVRAPLYLQTAHYVVESCRQNTTQVSRKICMQAELAGLLPMPTGCQAL
ncbi:MAG: shikimate kinase [Comamonas sp.]